MLILPNRLISMHSALLLLLISSLSIPHTIAFPILSEAQEKHIDNLIRTESSFSSTLKNLPPLISHPQGEQRTLIDKEIPSYVIDYAPMVHLYSEERYLPYDIASYVTHFHPEFANGSVPFPFNKQSSLKIQDLEILTPLNQKDDRVYLTANEDFDTDPDWLTGVKNKPSFYSGEIEDAPATLVVVDKGNGWIDAYWFYFYSFNQGPFVMGFGPYGDHVGDWEHSLVRFYKGVPVILWMSAHGGGGAYFYKNIERFQNGKHPVIFSARGTHANYASVGQHSHDAPYSILSDFTDRGPLWNPSLNYLAYTYNFETGIHNANGSQPGREDRYGNWLQFKGLWGDIKLDPKDPRQHWSPFEWKYITGPCGPLCKNLFRISPCQRSKWWNFWNGCNIRRYIQFGDGIFDSEGNNNCGGLYRLIKWGWLRGLVELFSFGGWTCWILDHFLG